MNNQKIINEIKELLSKLEQETKNNKIDDMEKFKIFKPKENENYFYIEVDGEIFENTNLSHNNFNNNILKRNRVFKTRKHAEEYIDFMDMMKEKSRPFIPGKSNYSIYYCHVEKKLYYETWHYSQTKELYFDAEVAKRLIENYPNEIKHWYLAELIYLKSKELDWYE